MIGGLQGIGNYGARLIFEFLFYHLFALTLSVFPRTTQPFLIEFKLLITTADLDFQTRQLRCL
jgi:hypothetical protein